MKKLVFISLFVCISGFFGVANAQLTNFLPETEINVKLIPSNPKAKEVVSVSLTSYATNIDAANIVWRINGKNQKSGIGEKIFSFTVGELNTTTTLRITITTQEGEVIEKTLNIKPTSVDLIWESEGFVPPFYKGKSLFSHQNKLTFIALPHITSSNGVEIGAKNLIYTWKKNGSVIEDASGFGKNTYSFVSSLISRPVEISVNATTLDSGATGFASITLSPAEPFVVFYKKDPAYGVEFQKALYDTIRLAGSKEIIVTGIPLFFGIADPNNRELTYKWTINGIPIDSNAEQFTQVFRQKEGTVGISKIGLSIENTKKILQYATNNFNLMFGE